MLSKSQKVYLKSLCNTLKPLVMIGKNLLRKKETQFSLMELSLSKNNHLR